MVTVATIADRTLKTCGMTYDEINATEATALTIVEYMIDDAIDEINGECGTSIADLSGTAGSKSLVGTETELAAVKLLSKLKLRSRQSQGKSVSIGSLSTSQSTSDFGVEGDESRLKGLLNVLRGRTFVRT